MSTTKDDDSLTAPESESLVKDTDPIPASSDPVENEPPGAAVDSGGNADDSAEERSGGAEESDDDETFREPVVDGRNISFKSRILNEYLVCSLCMGYFRNAHTIRECLHTFCKTCIVEYLVNGRDCPRCQVHLGTNPMDQLKYDRQLATIVEKIFPYKAADSDPEAEKRKHEEKQHQAEDETKLKKLKKSEALKKFYADEVGFELSVDESEADSGLKNLDKPFIRTSSKVTILHLKKYLQKKLNLPSLKDLEITYRGDIMGNELSLEYILRSRGLSAETKNPIFKFQRSSGALAM